MARKIRIVTSSLGVFENTKTPFNRRNSTLEENMSIAEAILETAKKVSPDIVLLPETFRNAGRSIETYRADAETEESSISTFLSAKASEGSFYLIAGRLIAKDESLSNEAHLFDRSGDLVGIYQKNYPVESEITAGVVPGSAAPTFELDFGKIGMVICFDLNWKSIWEHFAREKIDLACWISAYEGGYPLQMMAQYNRYPIVSAVHPFHARIIDFDGTVLSSTSQWCRTAFYELNLDRELYHTDNQIDLIEKLQLKLGADISIKAYTDEHLFLVTNHRTDCTIKDIEKEFGLVSYTDYINQCTAFRNSHLRS